MTAPDDLDRPADDEVRVDFSDWDQVADYIDPTVLDLAPEDFPPYVEAADRESDRMYSRQIREQR